MPKGIYIRKPFTNKHKKHISKSMQGGNKTSFRKGHLPWNTNKKRPEFSGEKHYAWKGGKKRHSMGYILIYNPQHPFKNVGKYVFEHRLVMEKYLGRYLKSEEQIHHRNSIRNDNRLENLEIVGKPHFGKICCPYCQKEFLIK